MLWIALFPHLQNTDFNHCWQIPQGLNKRIRLNLARARSKCTAYVWRCVWCVWSYLALLLLCSLERCSLRITLSTPHHLELIWKYLLPTASRPVYQPGISHPVSCCFFSFLPSNPPQGSDLAFSSSVINLTLKVSNITSRRMTPIYQLNHSPFPVGQCHSTILCWIKPRISSFFSHANFGNNSAVSFSICQ